jgi:hypothetical protein
MDAATLETFLASAGIRPRADGADRWVGTIHARGRDWEVRARRTSNWLVLEAGPLPPAPHDALLRANRTLGLARYALVDGSVHVLAELPTQNLDPPEVAAAIRAIDAALDRYPGST